MKRLKLNLDVSQRKLALLANRGKRLELLAPRILKEK